MAKNLDWRGARAVIRKAREFVGELPPPGEGAKPFHEIVFNSIGLDIRQAQHVYGLFHELNQLVVPSAELADFDDMRGFLELTEEQSGLLTFAVGASWAYLVLYVAQYVPSQVKDGSIKRQRIKGSPFDLDSLPWSKLKMRLEDMSDAERWKAYRINKEGPGLLAWIDQVQATMAEQETGSDMMVFYMLGASHLLGAMLVAQFDEDPDLPAQALRTFRNCLSGCLYLELPRRFRELMG